MTIIVTLSTANRAACTTLIGPTPTQLIVGIKSRSELGRAPACHFWHVGEVGQAQRVGSLGAPILKVFTHSQNVVA